LISDGVGVGKTISAGYIIVFLQALGRHPALVVCPPGLMDKWRGELSHKFGLEVVPLRSREELFFATDTWNDEANHSQVYVVPSSLLSRTEAPFVGPIVIDELHNFRNSDTQSWMALHKIATTCSHRIGLTATPINNALSDLAAELTILLGVEYFTAEALVLDLWRPGRRETLYSMLTRFSKDRLNIHFARRIVRDVRVVMPDRFYDWVVQTVKEIRGRPEGEAMFRDEVTYFRLAASSARAFAKSVGAAVLPFSEKVDVYLSILRRHLNERLIVFCEFEETAQELAELDVGRETFVVTGAVPLFRREGIIAAFRSTDTGVLIMTSVGAEGLDMQCCSTMINYDLNWNPMVLEQRIGRIDRIGQAKSEIHIYNIIVDGSIDDRIINALGRKLGLVEGSALEPASVLENSGHHALFMEESFNQETTRAEALARALELSRAVVLGDYELAALVDTSYCNIKKVQPPKPMYCRGSKKRAIGRLC
jgi:SNF2 family DNA or RNA helicase